MIDAPKASDDQVLLFTCYTRFEFALKECGYIVKRRGLAKADWPRFAEQDCLKDVMQKAAENPDVRELLAKPPKVQITEGDCTWRWDESSVKQIKTLRDFFDAVKQVRDNLFHGGKSGPDPRDDVFCRAALAVLTLCLERAGDVRAAFEGRY